MFCLRELNYFQNYFLYTALNNEVRPWISPTQQVVVDFAKSSTANVESGAVLFESDIKFVLKLQIGQIST